MANRSGARGLLRRRPALLIVAVAVIGLLAFGFWLFLFIGHGGYTWRSEVSVLKAELHSPDRLTLIVASCNKDPEVSLLRETDVDVQVKVIADSHPFLLGGGDCVDIVEVQLQGPLGDRILVDHHTEQLVAVRTFGSSDGTPEQSAQVTPPEMAPPEIDDPPSAAELEDLQAAADQKGISLQEAIDRYAWNDNFSLAVSGIRQAFPEDFTGSEIVDAGHAWVGFSGSAPEGLGEMIERFTSSHSGVSVEVRTNLGFTEVEKKRALEAVHFAVMETPEVLDAVTYFDFETHQIRSTVLLKGTASDSVLDDLNALATESLTDAIREDILNSITISVVRSEGPILSGDE